MTPLNQLTAALTGRYDIEREIGAGGMATVYLARDVKHNRKVALKVLKPELGAVLGVERFLSEIQVTANLQHPNLLPLFDSGEANGLLFYVMPFVEGESLRARLDREKQLPVDEAVRIAGAIAGALDYAHEHGVIHRDLKPENILLQAGQPVIADFGIALAVSNAGGARVTQTGLSLGTPQYMSPEQATGDRVIDARSDIYSLSAMTYEMLVGDPPHVASTAQAIVAKVLTERPPSVQVARPAVGDAIAFAVERGLEKLPADRWTSAGEFGEALRGKLSTGATRSRATMAGSGHARGASRATRLAMAGMAVATIAATAVAVCFATKEAPTQMLATFEAAFPDSVSLYGGTGRKIALSRDGSLLAFVGEDATGRRSVYVRRLDNGVTTRVAGTDAAANPSFIADGQALLFLDGNVTKKIGLSGGIAETIADSTRDAASGGEGVFVAGHIDGSLLVRTGDGAVQRRRILPDSAAGQFRLRWPHLLPGGQATLIAIDRSSLINVIDSLRLGVVDLKSGKVTDLGVAGTNPQFVAPDRIVYGASGGLVMTVRFSVRSYRVMGSPERIATDVWQGAGGASGFAVSHGGVLATHSGRLQIGSLRQLLTVNERGQERPTAIQPLPASSVRVSSDGRRVALATTISFAVNDATVMIGELASGATARLVADSSSRRPEWHRDGRQVVFLSGSGSPRMQPWDRSEAPRTLYSKSVEEVVPGPVGGFWAFRIGLAGSSTSSADIWIARDDSLEHPRPFIATRDVAEYSPRISPNGKLLAFVSEEGGAANVYVQALPGPGGRVPVSIGGGREPMWSPDGSTLFYRTGRVGGPFIRARIMGGALPTVLGRDSLFADRYFAGNTLNNTVSSYDVLPSGRDLLVISQPITSATQRNSVTVVMNWQQMLAGAKNGARPDP